MQRQHKSWDSRIKRAKLEPQFRKLHDGYLEEGFATEEAFKMALDQIKPAVCHWESQNRELVDAKRLINQKRAKEIEIKKQEIAARIEQKQRVGEDILAEARELMELEHPMAKPNYKPSQDPWGDLAMSVPAIEADYYKVVWWVNNNYATPVEALSPLECPCRAAVTMLKTIRENPMAYKDFLKDHFSKLAPSKSELDAQANKRQDNSKLLDMFSVFENDLNRRYKGTFRSSKTVDRYGEVIEDDDTGDEDGTDDPEGESEVSEGDS